MTWRWARRGVFEAVFQRTKLPDSPIQLGRFVQQQRAVDLGCWAIAEHRSDLVERKSGQTAERYQGQAVEHVLIERASQPTPSQGLYQAFLFVEAQRRSRDARALGYLRNFDQFHA